MKKIKMVMDRYEYNLIVNAIYEFRNNEIAKDKPVNFVNEVLEKWINKDKVILRNN